MLLPWGFSGQIEADETFIGGAARNMHKAKRAAKITGTGGKDKTAVLGILVSGGGGGGHFGGPESATPPMLGGTEWRLGGVRVNRHSALRAGIFKA